MTRRKGWRAVRTCEICERTLSDVEPYVKAIRFSMKNMFQWRTHAIPGGLWCDECYQQKIVLGLNKQPIYKTHKNESK